MKPHSLLHNVFGLGLGLLLAGLVSALAGSTGVVLGIILVIVGIGGEFFIQPKKTGQ